MGQISKLIFKDKYHYLTSPFGNRAAIDVNGNNTNSFHNGSDYGTNNIKLEQYAIENGKVIGVGSDHYGAKFIIVEYPKLNLKIGHYHLDKIYVKENDIVNENTILGLTGETGLATGIHLHLTVYSTIDEVYLDPEKYTIDEKQAQIDFSDYELHEQVLVNGILFIDSYGSKAGKKLKNHVGNITLINKAGTKPYHIDKLGWVDFNSLSKITNSIYHIVKKNENLSMIAKQYNTTWQNIYNLNKENIKNPDIIYPEQKLRIR